MSSNKLTPFDILHKNYPNYVLKIDSEVSKVTFKKKKTEQEQLRKKVKK